jgi:hypothetical protein
MGEEVKEGVPVRVKFTFRKAENYKTHFINGAYGGLSPHGDVICNFFFEYKTLPESEEAIVTDGKLTPVKNALQESEMTRELKVGVIMSPSEARIIAKWLNDKVDEFEKIFQ